MTSQDGGAVLEVRNLRAERDDRELFSHLDFSVSPGTVVHVTGPNGAGKTTLLRMLCGLLPPAAGEILWRGSPIGGAHPGYARELAWLGHADGLKLDLSAAENLLFSARLGGFSLTAASVEEGLAAAGLYGFEDTLVRHLSAGQRRRVALVRVCLSPARLWLLDEPMTALDVTARQWVEKLIGSHVAIGGLVVLSTHQPLQLDASDAVRFVHLESGQ